MAKAIKLFKGYISYAEFRDKALSEEEIIKVYEEVNGGLKWRI